MSKDEPAKEEITPESRDERLDRQTNEQFSELGRFVQDFEQLVHAIRTSCLFLLPTKTTNDQMLVNILLHHHVMTAGPLFECMRALYGEVIKQLGKSVVPEEAEAISGVLKQAATDMQDLVSRRNSLLHATWFIGWAGEKDTDFSNFNLTKGKPTKDGFVTESPLRDIDELRQLRAKCTELTDTIWRLHAAFLMHVFKPNEGPRVRFNFEKVDGRWSKKERNKREAE